MPPFRLNPSIFNPALYARIRAVWFDDLSPTATTAPQAMLMKWFGLGTDPAAFDAQCTSSFRAALDSIGPKEYNPLASLSSSSGRDPFLDWETEKAQAAEIARPFLPECKTPEDALALVLLLDQMPRNIFRKDQKLIYSHYDLISRAIVRQLLFPAHPPPSFPSNAAAASAAAAGTTSSAPCHRPDLSPNFRLAPVRRTWFYIPLEHSEHLQDHSLVQELLEATKRDVEEQQQEGGGATDEPAVKYIESTLSFEVRHRVLIERFGRYPHRNPWLGREDTEEEKAFLAGGGDSFGTKRPEKE